ncbi:MAG: hypothetical protein M3680_03545, partial [Myxococcota bacterium]|nr:hypothetical protein [Myxococcota bacterium]
RLLRRIGRLRRRTPAFARIAAQVGAPLLVSVLLVKGCADTSGPIQALELGTGIRGGATVEARLVDGDWQTCDYSATTASYVCDQLLVAYDSMASLLNDAAPSWGFNTPAIEASAHRADVEMRVRVEAELTGTYWMAASEGRVTLRVSGEREREVDRAIEAYSGGTRTIELRAAVPTTTWSFTFVREDTIVPRRTFLAPPPEAAPASVRAIR